MEIDGWINQAKEMNEEKKTKRSPKLTPIVEFEGIGNDYSKTLEKAGYSKVEDLLSINSVKIKNLSATTKISDKLINKWVEHADLMRIRGVGPEYADVLNQIGIDSVKEFAQRNPKNTLDRIMELDKKKPDVFRKPPRVEDIEEWREEAKKIK
ncbi:MAG: DUF4332 domain-containing protein [Promethearchaeota archaeon]|jgi:predicted flap endonuclease-1-like 5' DNA nuclease